jgi:hypothetical protein
MFGAITTCSSGWGEAPLVLRRVRPGPHIGALFPDPEVMTSISLKVIYAVQHLYFIVVAPTLFLPFGIVLVTSLVLPHLFGYMALVLGFVFAALGVTFLLRLVLPASVTAFAGVQALLWAAAATTLIVRIGKGFDY